MLGTVSWRGVPNHALALLDPKAGELGTPYDSQCNSLSHSPALSLTFVYGSPHGFYTNNDDFIRLVAELGAYQTHRTLAGPSLRVIALGGSHL